MLLTEKLFYIFLIILLLLLLVGIYSRPWTIGLFIIVSGALLIYQVIMILKDPSNEPADPIEPH